MDNNIKSPWPGPAGMIPVTSGKADDANVFNRNYLDSIHVEMRVIDAVEPTLKTVIFGEEFDSPIMMPAFSHLNKVLKDGKKPMLEYARAAKKLNTVNWVGMEPNEEYAEIAAEGARTVRIIKPFADHNIILDEIQFAINTTVNEDCDATSLQCCLNLRQNHHGSNTERNTSVVMRD